MERENLITIDDVIAIMEEFKVTRVDGRVSFPSQFGRLKLPEHAKSLGLEIIIKGPKEGIQAPYISDFYLSRGLKDGFYYFDDHHKCGIHCPNLESFRQLVSNFKAKNEELPSSLSGYYEGGIHPKNSKFSLPLLFLGFDYQKRIDEKSAFLYKCCSDLDMIRANGYRYPFRGNKYA